MQKKIDLIEKKPPATVYDLGSAITVHSHLTVNIYHVITVTIMVLIIDYHYQLMNLFNDYLLN